MGSLTLAMAILILLGSGGMASGQANAPPVAVTVVRETDVNTAESPLSLQKVLVNVGDAWNQPGNYLDVNYNSTFFFHINAGAQANQAVNMNLRGYYHADIFRSSTTHNGIDTTGRDIISPVVAGVQIYVENDFGAELYGDSGKQTSFTAFDLQNFLDSTDREIFCAYNQDRVTSQGTVPFAHKLVDTRSSWNTVSPNKFYVRNTGFYFFTFNAGVDTSTAMRAEITRNDNLLSELSRLSTSHNGQDVISKSIMADLNAGDSIGINLLAGTLYSDAERQTSFCGFRYDPASANLAAWSVFRTTSETTTDQSLDPLAFGQALVNIDNIFSASTNKVSITISGLYYVQLTVGVQAGAAVDVFIKRDRVLVEANVWRTSTNHNGIDSSSTALLLELYAGNELSVVLGANSGIYSSLDRETTFTGFLIDFL